MSRVKLFGLEIDALRMPEAVAQLLDCARGPRSLCKFVVTPNVDHTVMFRERADLRGAYADAAMVLADGMPVVWASRLLRKAIPERLAGSDLVPALFTTASEQSVNRSHQSEPLRVYLLGAGPGVADRAGLAIMRRWTGVEVVGTYCPPLGFERDPQENDAILAAIAAARPDVLIIGLGAPKQELWVHAHQARIEAKVALCVGAAIDFLAGEKRRAPRWMCSMGLEWCHRLASEPRRLMRRYARDAWLFPQLVWQEWRATRNALRAAAAVQTRARSAGSSFPRLTDLPAWEKSLDRAPVSSSAVLGDKA